MKLLTWIPDASRKMVLMMFVVAITLIQVTFYETEFLTESTIRTFLILKLAPSFLLLAMLPWAFRNPSSTRLKILIALIFAYYPIIGSLYRPWYALATLQLVLIYGFFADAKPKLYWSYAFVSFLGFYIPFWLRWPHVPENAVHLGKGDWIGIGVQQILILALTYVFVFRAQKFRSKRKRTSFRSAATLLE